jgi:hypothetical protein
MAPVIDDFRSYEHYLVARQAVTDTAVNRLTPTEDQKIILIIIGVYTAAILILWNMPIAKIILSPFKVRNKKSVVYVHMKSSSYSFIHWYSY